MSYKISEDSANLAIEGHEGTWYVIATTYHEGNTVFLLEHEQYGEDAACIIVDEDGNIVLDDVYNGFDDLVDAYNV